MIDWCNWGIIILSRNFSWKRKLIRWGINSCLKITGGRKALQNTRVIWKCNKIKTLFNHFLVYIR